MEALGAAGRAPGRVYFTGGATAVLLGWRASTIDVDVKLVPDHDALLRALPALKEQLQLNAQDLADVRELVGRGLVEPQRALDYFERIEPELYRYPAIHGPAFRLAVEEVFR